MNQIKVLGIDPDSKGFESAFINVEHKITRRYFHVSTEELQQFVEWVKKIENVIIGIEGSNGLNKPIEKILRANKIIFYSFKASDVDRFRKAVLGENKNNKKDAESVARFASALASQDKLKDYRRVWFPEEDLQLLTRSHDRITQNKTAEINSFWKLIRAASHDLYLLLKGKRNRSKEEKMSKLDNKSLLNLFQHRPDLSEWKDIPEEEMIEAMGGKMVKGVFENVRKIKEIAKKIKPVNITQSLKGKGENNKAIQNLQEIKGISTITSTKMMAEIINILRFRSDDNLASYSGLGQNTYNTGESKKERKAVSYNRRLKNIFLTAAKNFVCFNKDHHLTGYYRNLVKTGMQKTEAYKRVARALVRIVYKRLYGLIEISDSIESLK